ncbi:lectin-like domain-containing protein [Flaviaesturariibacter amylovorans]|uniref:PKD domain-containing protein n=1 Tax=Flaviaesturariibacter amylovorans TaxID=1084520 RepID=A0ABP8GVB3_9BACT
MYWKTVTLALAGLLFFYAAGAQYILNGSAERINCNCYLLTPDRNTQSGSVWNGNKISLLVPFDFTFNVYLGCSDATGADGIVFMLQPLSTSVGTSGEGMGFSGVSPSIGIALDTWQNPTQNDPAFDHISIQANGITNHSSDLVPPVPVSATSDNVEDCNWHQLRISWDPSTRWLRTWFDGAPRVEKQVDLVGSIFNGDPMVYWGFSAATGGAVNIQKFCTALNPGYTSSLARDTFCVGTPIRFRDSSVSFAPVSAWFWDFGDGTTSTLEDPPPHIYPTPGPYELKFAITGMDGCRSDTLHRPILVASPATASFSIRDTCFKRAPVVQPLGSNVGVAYEWRVDGTLVSTDSLPLLNGLTEGPHGLQLTVRSLYGCSAPQLLSRSFTMLPLPRFSQDLADGCVQQAWPFSATLTGTEPVRQWFWDFGDGRRSGAQGGTLVFRDTAVRSVRTWAFGNNGCPSDTLSRTVRFAEARGSAGRDTVVLSNRPALLHGWANGPVLWTPATGLSNASIPNPTVTLNEDARYLMTVTTLEGCVLRDSLFVEVFKGSDVWVPNAFTPNNDGRNDRFRPLFKGIRELLNFSIYNRWGELVYATKDPQAGWDGALKGGREAGNDTFVWMLHAIDWEGRVYQLKGTVTVIR